MRSFIPHVDEKIRDPPLGKILLYFKNEHVKVPNPKGGQLLERIHSKQNYSFFRQVIGQLYLFLDIGSSIINGFILYVHTYFIYSPDLEICANLKMGTEICLIHTKRQSQ